MKNADSIRAKFGANIVESMGDAPAGAGGLPTGFAAQASGQYAGTGRIRDALAIELDRIVPDPDQPRREFDEEAIDRLAASLKARGQLQPCRVRWDSGREKWVIIAGERRWRAARRAGLTTLQCIEARGPATPEDLLEDQVVENCVREDLKPIEQAHAYRTLMQRRGWSYSELSDFLHISKGTIAKALALLDLPEAVQDLVERGELAPKAAYEISRLGDQDSQVELARQVVAEKLTVAETTDEVTARKSGTPARGGGQSKAKGKGRGVARKVTKRVYRHDGVRVTVERAKGLDREAILAALMAAAAQERGEGQAPEPRPESGGADDGTADQGRGVAA